MKKLTILLSLSLFCFYGCNDDEVLTIDSSNENSKNSYSKGIANAPDQSGMIVIRTESEVGWGLIDSRTKLTTITGYDASDICNGVFLFDIVPMQLVVLPNNEMRVIQLLQGDIFTTVYDGAFDPINEDFCEFIANTPILAQGIAQIIITDNDPYADPNSKNTNAFGVRIHGRLPNGNNEIKSLHATLQFVWNKKEDFDSFFDVQVSVSVQLH